MSPDEEATASYPLPEHIPKRWLFITQYYPPEMGATQVRLHTLIGILRELGVEVEVFTAMPNYPTGVVPEKYRGKWTYKEVIDGVTVHRSWVYGYNGPSTIKRLLNHLSYVFSGMLNLLKLRRPDVLFVESLPLPVGILGMLGKTCWGVRYVYNIPDMQIETARELGWIKSEAILKAAESFENMLMRNSWKVSTVTYRFIDYYHRRRKIPRDQLTMLPNGADTRVLQPMPPSREMIDRFGVAGKTVFVYAGTHAIYHRMETLVEAAERLRDRDDIRIVLVGAGPGRQPAIDLAREKGLENVVFGEAPFKETAALMSIARAAVVLLRRAPSCKYIRLAKTFPPMACGKPVIFSGDCESTDLIKHCSGGLVTAPEDPDELAKALLELADDEDKAKRLGHNALEFVQSELHWPNIVRRWLDELAHGRSDSAVEAMLC